jgi:anti-anti-sigma regulatory factor
MKSEALDITIESRGKAILLVLAGPFHNEQIPNIREKVTGIIDDGSRDVVMDLEGVTVIGDGVVAMFLSLLNFIRAKHGDLRLIFRNTAVSAAFSPYRSIFSIYPDSTSLAFSGILRRLKRRGALLSRKTGIRLSPPVAIFIFFVLAGWFLTLALIISMQNSRLRKQELDISELTTQNSTFSVEIERMRERLRPIEQLGLIRETDAPAAANSATLKPLQKTDTTSSEHETPAAAVDSTTGEKPTQPIINAGSRLPSDSLEVNAPESVSGAGKPHVSDE